MSLLIKYHNIPTYLQAGQFFRSLSCDDPESEIEVPSECFQQHVGVIIYTSELIIQCKVYLYWMLDEIPWSVLEFCSLNGVEVWRDAIANVTGAVESNLLSSLLAAYSVTDMVLFKDILKNGRWELIVHAISRLSKGCPWSVCSTLRKNGEYPSITRCL